LAERRAIQARLAALDHEHPARDLAQRGGDNTPTSEPMEAVQESVMKDLELASREVLLSRLTALTRAEERIRDGTYGRCEVCGCPIPPARLRAMPEAVRCVPCAEGEAKHSATTAGP
jgi:DnaK suppressor protein